MTFTWEFFGGWAFDFSLIFFSGPHQHYKWSSPNSLVNMLSNINLLHQLHISLINLQIMELIYGIWTCLFKHYLSSMSFLLLVSQWYKLKMSECTLHIILWHWRISGTSLKVMYRSKVNVNKQGSNWSSWKLAETRNFD